MRRRWNWMVELQPGRRFGLWQVLQQPIGRFARCRCLGCDTEHEVDGNNLVRGASISCRHCSSRRGHVAATFARVGFGA
jgi:hypothetical protein